MIFPTLCASVPRPTVRPSIGVSLVSPNQRSFARFSIGSIFSCRLLSPSRLLARPGFLEWQPGQAPRICHQGKMTVRLWHPLLRLAENENKFTGSQHWLQEDPDGAKECWAIAQFGV